MITLHLITLLSLAFGYIDGLIRTDLKEEIVNYQTYVTNQIIFDSFNFDIKVVDRSNNNLFARAYGLFCTVNYCDTTDYSSEQNWKFHKLTTNYIPDAEKYNPPIPQPTELNCTEAFWAESTVYNYGRFVDNAKTLEFNLFYNGTYRILALQGYWNLNIRWKLIVSRANVDTKLPYQNNEMISGMDQFNKLLGFSYQEKWLCHLDAYGFRCNYKCVSNERRFCIPHYPKLGYIITEQCKPGYAEGYLISKLLITCGSTQTFINYTMQRCIYYDTCFFKLSRCQLNEKCYFVDNDTFFCYNEEIMLKNDFTDFMIASLQQIAFDGLTVEAKIGPPMIPDYAIELFEISWYYNKQITNKTKTINERVERNKNIQIISPTTLLFRRTSINFTFGDDYLVDIVVNYRYGFHLFNYTFDFTFSDKPVSITFPDEFYFSALTYFYFTTNLETNKSIQISVEMNNKSIITEISLTRFFIPDNFLGLTVITIKTMLIINAGTSITHTAKKLSYILPYIKFIWNNQSRGQRTTNDTIQCVVQTSLPFEAKVYQIKGPSTVDTNNTLNMTLLDIIPGRYKFACVLNFTTKNLSYTRYLSFYYIERPTKLCLSPFPGFKGTITKCSSNGFPTNQGRFIMQLIQKNYSIQLFRVNSRFLKIPFKIYEHLIYTIRCVNLFFYGDNEFETEIDKEITFPLSQILTDYQVEKHTCQNSTQYEPYGTGQHEEEIFYYYRFYIIFNEVNIEIGSTDQILFFIFGSLAVYFAYLGYRFRSRKLIQIFQDHVKDLNFRRIIRSVSDRAIYQMRSKHLNKQISKMLFKDVKYDEINDEIF